MMPADLRPPAQWTHLRWHWLIPHNDYDQKASREEPEVMLWCPEKSREWMQLDYWKTEVGTMTPAGAGYLGWRYYGPCLPNAWVADPDDVGHAALDAATRRAEVAERALVEFDRLSLGIESAVRNADPGNYDLVLAAIRRARELMPRWPGVSPISNTTRDNQ